MRLIHLFTLCAFVTGSVTLAAEPEPAPENGAAPIPKLDADGPTSFVTGLAFGPDGQTLYAAGWDKIIRVWRRDTQGQFQLDAASTFRVPIGPGPAGQLNAIAISSDGRWLAAGGNGTFRHGSTFDRPGLIVPAIGAMDKEMREDQGTIFVFDVRTREVRQLRGHEGAVVSLEFADGQPLLVSAAQEWDEQAQTRRGGVRLWNVADGKELAASKGLPEPKARPGLCVVRQNANARGTLLPNVAIAWGDDRFLIWNPNSNRLQPANDGRYNNTVAEVAGVGVVTGNANGLKIWQPAEPPAVLTRFEQTLRGAIPRAIAALPANRAGNPESVAIVARETGREDDRLYLVNARSGQVAGQPQLLWNGRGTQPAVAASAAGDIAVAGGRDHRILVYRTSELRQNRATRQVLDSSGETVRVAAIARQGERRGLLLSEQPKQQPGQVRTSFMEADRVFNVNDGAFAVDLRGWRIDMPEGRGWSVRPETVGTGAQQHTVLSVLNGGRVASRIDLGERQQIGDCAVLPPEAPHNRALLAVAYFDFARGQPILAMFDGSSGERFREFLGHTGRITSVAFSGDGRFLTTAADDQTVCVWALTDLDQVLGTRGQLTGLTVDASDGDSKLTVAEVDRQLEAAGISKGDVLEGIMSGDEVRPFDSVRSMYETISLVKPGSTVVLRRVREANDRRDVKVVVGQGVDERKPLFTFFASRPKARLSAQWIGWSPLGPYDSSDLSVEKLLGWHFNTGRAEEPVSFASIDQYRGRFATRGLLKKLLDTGRPQLAAQRDPDPPSLSLWLPQTGKDPLALEQGTSVVVHQAPAKLEASSAPFPAEQIESIRWRIDDATGDFESAEGQWQADLAGIDWKRGIHSVQVQLTTKPPQRELKQVLALVYQPSPPKATSTLPAHTETSKETFDFQAEVAPAVAGEAMHVTLTHQNGTKEPVVVREVKSSEPSSIQEQVKLQPGLNLFNLIAENDAAMRERADNERTSLAFEVYYNPPKVVPGPQIELRDLATRADDGTAEVQPLASDARAVTHSSTVVLRGTVRGAEVLSVAQYKLDPQPAAALAGFAANKAKEFTFQQQLTLRPGANRLLLQAQSPQGELTERLLQLEYEPPLPVVTARPLPGRVFDEQYRFVADLTSSADRQPYEVQLQVNGETLPEEKVVLADGQLNALVALRPGDNRLELRLSNRWGTEPVVQTFGVEYIRAPKILALTSDRKNDPDAVVLHLRVESERRPAEAIVRVNGEVRRTAFDVKESDEAKQWLLDFRPLLLEPGESRISVSVKDQQAESPSESLVMNVEKRSEPVPEIVVLSEHNHAVLPDSKVPVEVVVRSASPIQDIVLEDGTKLLHSASELAAQRKNDQGIYEYLLKTALPSGSDSKLWRLEAINRGGRHVVDLPNVVIEPPVSLVLESVALRTQRDRPYQLNTSGTGAPVLDKVLPDSAVLLSGSVRTAPDSSDASRPIPVQVWVNGFLQKPVLAGPLKPGSLRRQFNAEIELTQLKNNLVEVGIIDPNVPSEATNRTRLSLDCAKPNTSRRLHLLVVAVGAKREEGAEVRKRAVNAVQGTIKSAREFTAPSFEKGIIHEVLLGSAVQRNKVLFEIGRLARNLRPNDVAMIYYQGNVHETDETFYLTTSATKSLADPKQTEISRDELNRWFGSLAGAQLILLDVDRSATPEQSALAARSLHARWPADSHIAFFRFAWAPPEPTNTPNEPVLLTALEQSTRKSETLAQIDSSLATFSTAASSRYPAKIVYEKHLPPRLGMLEFGAVSERP